MTERPEDIAQVAAAMNAAERIEATQAQPAVPVGGSGEDVSQTARSPEDGAAGNIGDPAISEGHTGVSLNPVPGATPDYPAGQQGTGTTQ